MRKTFATCLVLLAFVIGVRAGSIEVNDPNLMKEAIDFLNASAEFDTMYLTVPGGVYTTHDTLFYEIKTPITILAKPGLAEKPIITHSDDSTSVLEMFRIYDDLTVEGVVFDGGREETHGMKYALRVGNSPDESIHAKKGLNIILRNCDFINIARKKDYVSGEGHALYFLKNINTVGKVLIENCYFENISDEAIRMTETEKYPTTRCLDTLIVRNCTFNNINAECVRFYADKDTSTADAYVLIENCTVYNCAPRFCYIKNNAGTQVRNIIVTNGRLSTRRLDRNDYTFEVQGIGSHLSHCDTLNLAFDPLAKREDVFRATKGATVDKSTMWGFDPKQADPENRDWTLLPESHAYYSGHDREALGDRRWATNVPTVIPFRVTIEGEGTVLYDPPKEGNCYDSGVTVTLTAVPDSGWTFAGWSGTMSGTNATESITVEAPVNVTATFIEGGTTVERSTFVPNRYELSQNYPNPFNPYTTIPFSLKKSGHVKLEVFDVLGRRVAILADQRFEAGVHRLFFSASGMSSGVYFYKLTTDEFSDMKKMILAK